MDASASRQGAGIRGASSSDGTVTVAVDVATSEPAIWDALTRSEQLARWFATVDPPLRAGGRTRADFGDGDFFDVTVVAMDPPNELELDWTFLGVGSPHRVRWSIRARPGGARVEVIDHDPGRPASEAAEMVNGWSDFLDRLRRYLESGTSTRYDLRDALDGSVDLPDGSDDPLSAETILRWLPVATDGREPRWFFIIDELGPRRFAISDWTLDLGRSLSFAVAVGGGRAEAGPPTRCTVRVSSTDHGTRLSFRQTGWAAARLPTRRTRQLRSRFADTWREALRTARDRCAP